MRTISDIVSELDTAASKKDAAALSALAGELSTLGTDVAMAHAERALGVACAITRDHHTSMMHCGRALAAFTALGDQRYVASVSATLGSMHASTGQYAEALEHLHHALASYEELHDRDGIAVVTGNIGLVYDSLGDFPRAMQQLNRALEMHEDMGDRYNTARVASNLGNVYWSVGSYPQALSLLRRALAIHEEDQNHRGIAIVTGNIGNIYHSTGDAERALDHYQRALALHEEHADRAHAARIMANMGIVHDHLGNYEEALGLGRRALALHEQIGDRAGVGTVTGNIILALLDLGRDDEAAQLLDLQSTMLMDEPETHAIHFVNRAKLAERTGDLDAAHDHLQTALAIVSEAGIKSDVALCHQHLRDLAQRRNDFAAYIEHNTEFARVSEEIRGKEATQQLTMLEAERSMEAERREREKERALLYGALPRSVADRMIRGEKVTGDHFENATVIFTDIVGFTQLSASREPREVVHLLEQIFSAFDAICERHNVTKIKTIGDSYMAVAFDDVVAAALCALEMQQLAYRIESRESDEKLLQFRLGMHCGPVTAGVIGAQRLQYDVWGDTVNVASRMESTGEAGRIHISAAFAAEIESRVKDQETNHESGIENAIENAIENREYRIEERGMIDVKGKGPMRTYWLRSA